MAGYINRNVPSLPGQVAVAVVNPDGTFIGAGIGYVFVQYADATWLYFCKGPTGSSLSSSVWQVWREARAQLLAQDADGNRNYDNPATDLVTVQGLTYS